MEYQNTKTKNLHYYFYLFLFTAICGSAKAQLHLKANLQNMHLWRGMEVTDGMVLTTDLSVSDYDNRFRAGVWGKRLLNYILCIRFFIEVHSIVSASRFFHMPTYLRVVIECQSRFFPFFPAFSRNCPDYFLHTSGSSSFRSLSDLGAR